MLTAAHDSSAAFDTSTMHDAWRKLSRACSVYEGLGMDVSHDSVFDVVTWPHHLQCTVCAQMLISGAMTVQLVVLYTEMLKVLATVMHRCPDAVSRLRPVRLPERCWSSGQQP